MSVRNGRNNESKVNWYYKLHYNGVDGYCNYFDVGGEVPDE